MHISSSSRSVITGAGSGFGRALALELAGRGGSLVLSDINLPSVQETAEEARRRGAREVKVLRCDVQVLADVEALAAACDGPVDLVVNNAGVSAGGLIGELSMADWRWTIEIDLFGVIHGCHVFVPILRQQGRGHILNVASAAGLVSSPGMAAYNVAKAGVVALSETLAAELHGSGVGVTVLCPTFFRTNIVNSGRFTHERFRQMGSRLIEKGRPVEEIVHFALRSVEDGELFSVPMADGRWMWRMKRLAPAAFTRLVARMSRMVENRNKKEDGAQ